MPLPMQRLGAAADWMLVPMTRQVWPTSPVQVPTVTETPSSGSICRHFPSISEVMVPLLLKDQAPLASQGFVEPGLGSGLQPKFTPTSAPSFSSQATISQQPPSIHGKSFCTDLYSPGSADSFQCWPGSSSLHGSRRRVPTGICTAMRCRVLLAQSLPSSKRQACPMLALRLQASNVRTPPGRFAAERQSGSLLDSFSQVMVSPS
mmetsp:Transcript_70547/g.206470  ORF Transcript_70547/g.206470 Transcript_70547/m.206470 type:complete len:205 (+) Transcript_70547:721-1335(+)